jgi:hypothetical protein
MTRDPKKFREIARFCTVLSKSAVTPEERDIFANLAETWRGMAASTESLHALLHQTPARMRMILAASKTVAAALACKAAAQDLSFVES